MEDTHTFDSYNKTLSATQSENEMEQNEVTKDIVSREQDENKPVKEANESVRGEMDSTMKESKQLI